MASLYMSYIHIHKSARRLKQNGAFTEIHQKRSEALIFGFGLLMQRSTEQCIYLLQFIMNSHRLGLLYLPMHAALETKRYIYRALLVALWGLGFGFGFAFGVGFGSLGPSNSINLSNGPLHAS